MFRISRTATLKGIGFLGAAALAATTAIAQPVPDAGTTLRQLEPPVLTLPRKPPPAVDVEKPARPALETAPAARFTLKAFRITGATVFAEAELQPLVQEYTGREVGFQELGEAAGRITRFYSQRGYSLATAYLPVQDIKDGVVEIAVIEGRMGSVQLLNRSHVRDAVVVSYLEKLQGRIVEDASLERKLMLVYDLPGVTPNKAVLSPGQAIGETDLRVELDPGRRIAGTVELDNYGGRFTGATRLSGSLDIFSPARLGDLLSIRAIKGDPGLEYGRIAYQIPIPGDGLQVGAAYSHVRYRLGKNFAALGANGEADSASAFAMYPLVRSRQFSLYGRLGYERKDFEDRIDATATVTEKRTDATTVTLSGDYVDGLGAGATSAFTLSYGRGKLRIETPAAKAIDDLTARTNGAYGRWALSYLRLQGLTQNTALFVSFYGQKASKNLDSSEKMSLGGVNGVRAYPQGEALGDSGYILTGELRHTFSLGALPGTMQVAGFLDTGEVTLNEEPFAAVANRRRLSGGGVSLSWTKANDFALRLAVARRIGNEPATAGSDSRTRAWLQAIKNF